MAPARARRRWGTVSYGVTGAAVMIAAWVISWAHVRPFSDWTFAPQWYGYILLADSIVYARQGRSLFRAAPHRWVRLLLASATFWWIFEALNLRVQNWIYIQPEPVGPLRFFVEATIDFSTVLPAVFETAALVNSFLATPKPPAGQTAGPSLTMRAASAWFGLGVACVALPMWQPGIFFPGVWVCLFFLADAVNGRRGYPSLIADGLNHAWRRLTVLGTAGLICGFLWEMWNFHALPKWIYHVPLVPQQRLFEMPLLGYLGYIPFAMECYAVWMLMQSSWRSRADPAFEAAL